MIRGSARWASLFSILAIISCGGSDLTLPNEGQPAKLAVVRGDRQNGTVGQPLPDSFVIRVTDRFDNPFPAPRSPGSPITAARSIPRVHDRWSRVGRRRCARSAPQPAPTPRGDRHRSRPVEPTSSSPRPWPPSSSSSRSPASIATSGSPLDTPARPSARRSDGNPIARARSVGHRSDLERQRYLGGTTTATSDDAGQVSFADS